MTSGVMSFLLEFTYCFIRTFVLSLKIHAKNRIDVVQTCNPPDTYWALGLFFRLLGATFVYDQHDLCPEIFDARFGENPGMLKRILRAGLVWCERRNYKTACEVISTNESYRELAMTRGKKSLEHVTIVRSGPNPERLYPIEPDASILGKHKYLLVYIGVMGPQDRVDIAIDVMDYITHEKNRDDIALALLGDGDCFAELKARTTKLKLDDCVEFTGRANDDVIRRYFSSAALGIAPDPATPFNSHSTHNKIMEYMIFSLPVVAFDLHETKKSGLRAVHIVEENADAHAMGDAILALVDDEARRKEMGDFGRARVLKELVWDQQDAAYVSVMKKAYAGSRTGRKTRIA